MRPRHVDIAPVVDILPAETESALMTLCHSGAVMRARISSRSGFTVTDTATGETVRGKGPVLVLIVNETLLKQGW